MAHSTELRRWFGHDPDRWREFRRRYRAQLSRRADLLNELRAIATRGRLTLVYAARDELHNDAVVLRDVLARRGSTAAKRRKVSRRTVPSARH
jgi:uncharacterized protein YeaO (DUF488 family)